MEIIWYSASSEGALESIFVCWCWNIWLERNNWVFNCKSKDVSEVVDAIVWSVSMWASRDKFSNDVSMFDLNLSQEAYFRRGHSQMSMYPILWSPPIRVLKLNFDGCFSKMLGEADMAA